MPAALHPTAVIAKGAELGEEVQVGPYCVIGPWVRIGDRTRLHAHVVLDGAFTLGADCEVYPFAALGHPSQDLKFRGGCPRAEVGDRTVIREYVTIHPSTTEEGLTRVGADCFLMAYAHIAHDCTVGDRSIIANCGTLAGHVVIEEEVVLGGLSAVHQFVRIGTRAMVGGCSKVTQDVPPYLLADGHPAVVRGINRVGLVRRGMSEEARRVIKDVYQRVYRRGLSLARAMEIVAAEVPTTPERDRLLAFFRASTRGICRGTARRGI